MLFVSILSVLLVAGIGADGVRMDTGMLNATWSGPWANPIQGNVFYKVYEDSCGIGWVTLDIPTVKGTATTQNNAEADIALPAELTPTRQVSSVWRVRNLAQDVFGLLQIQPTGVMFFGQDAQGQSFDGMFSAGFYRGSVTFCLS